MEKVRKLYPLLGSTAFLIVISTIFAAFLPYHEERANELNWVFDDPVFDYLPLGDYSLVIVILTYLPLVLYALIEWKTKYSIEKLMIAYAILLLMRMISLSLLPLKASPDIIHLSDPILNDYVYKGLIQSDLFFSGHTGLLFLMVFLSKRSWLFLIIGTTLGGLLIAQHVHYSIDVLGAIPFAFLAVKLTEFVVNRLFTRLKD